MEDTDERLDLKIKKKSKSKDKLSGISDLLSPKS